ncbi:MAG: hypothetical protein R2798_04315 [Chitinophagales bacterium]|nr:hypothetical protein [Bacteroidota bacterium]
MKFRSSLIVGSILLLANSIFLPAQEAFNVIIEPFNIANAPGVHSFSQGQDSLGRWLIIGGRIDGLHQRQPFATFLAPENNTTAFVIDPATQQVWASSLSVLPSALYEQLQSTNQQFFQRDNYLYITGGYGFSATANDHITYAKLTAIDVNGLVHAIVNGNTISPFFRQISDANAAITGGQLGYLDPFFYLVGGQYFEGKYNPQGPNNGPGFVQIYSNEIRKFKINDNGISLSISDYSAINDTFNLHRRDYNMLPQIFPDGTYGFTAFSGVFQPNVNLPFLNSIDITAGGYTVNNTFNQYLSQYHSAKIPLHDAANNLMHNLFFGGMSQYTLDANNNLVQDDNVPFVKTISRVSRFGDGSMEEVKLNIEMPTLVGSGAEFLPLKNENFADEMVLLNELPQYKTLIGYIYGGIESSQANIFFINDGTQSLASNTIFKVFIDKSTGCDIDFADLDTYTTGSVFTKEVSGKIQSVATVDSGANVMYDAGEVIFLMPGFIATTAANFHAFIEGCPLSSN